MNNNEDIGEKCQELYLISKKRLEDNDDPDVVDEVLVALWNTVEQLNQRFKDLQKVAQDQSETIATYYHKQDILESRIAQLTGEKSLNGMEFLKGETQ